MTKRKKITVENHNYYIEELKFRLEWMYSLDHIPARSDLELGYDYLYMLCGETINLDSLSLVDEYIQHYHFGIKTNIPLKNGEQRIRCLVLAILKQFEKKIPEAALLEFIIQLIKK